MPLCVCLSARAALWNSGHHSPAPEEVWEVWGPSLLSFSFWHCMGVLLHMTRDTSTLDLPPLVGDDAAWLSMCWLQVGMFWGHLTKPQTRMGKKGLFPLQLQSLWGS